MKSTSDSQPYEVSIYTGPVQWDELGESLQQQMSSVMNPYIQASPIVLFIGAGASMPLGMPTMAEFPQDFADTLSGNERHLWDTIVDFSADFSSVPSDSVNIEQVLTCIHKCRRSEQAAAQLDKKIYESPEAELIQAEFQNLEQALNEITTKVLDEICATYGEPKDPSKVVECYSPLFNVLAQHQISTDVFTTNYDLAFEVLADEKPEDFELVDGFQSSDKGTFNNNFVPYYDGEGHAIVLWKMHGSTSWKGKLPTGPVRKSSHLEYASGGLETILLPPTRDKTERRKLSMRPFTQMYGSLISRFMQIGSVKVLLVIGYGFGDPEIVDVIAEGFQAEQDANLIVVDPGSDVDKVYCSFGGSIDKDRIKVIQKPFCDCEGDTLEAVEEALRSALT